MNRRFGHHPDGVPPPRRGGDDGGDDVHHRHPDGVYLDYLTATAADEVFERGSM